MTAQLPEPTPQTAPDYTTPAAIISVVALIVAMIVAVTWGPPGLADKITPLLTPLLGAVVAGFMYVINQRTNAAVNASQAAQLTSEETKIIALDTHKAVNSQMDAAKAQITGDADKATALAVVDTQRQVQAARDQGLLEGHAAGLIVGQAQAASAINATLAAPSPAAEAPADLPKP